MADFDVEGARAAGFSDAEIEQYLAGSGRSPQEVRAALGPQPFNPLGALASGVRRLLGQAEEGPPQAMTRVTHTPVRWGGAPADSYGAYYPANDAIRINPEKLPQWNPNPEYLSNIMRHEQVHALLPGETQKQIEGYFDQNPAIAAVGRTEMARFDSDAAKSNRGLSIEAPAYAVQGYKFGLPDDIVDQYQSRMPEGVRRRYQKLLRK
jgi:hypothetical protein